MRHGGADNAGLWKVWDAFGIQNATMWGWWNSSTPVSTGRADVLATAYVRRGNATLIAIASWNVSTVNVSLRFDWAMLGITYGEVELVAPALPSFNRAQTARVWTRPDALIEVPALQGWLLLLQKRGVKYEYEC